MKGSFEPDSLERELYAEWESSGHFAPAGNGRPFCIAIPPPNITGRLHLGHAFQHTLMDALTRYQRMKGRQALWQMGTDHASIATQMIVERQLEADGISRDAIGREEFVNRVWEWRDRSGGEISQQLRRMGSSLDWSRDRFTMDEGFCTAVNEVFVRLYEDGLIYKRKRLVNWDPVLKTAVSDLEVDNVDEQGHLWHIRYPLLDGVLTSSGANHVVVATTRPETMLGDTGLAVHPDDPRYRGLIGARARLPLVDREIPIVADPHVDPEFGTGCVKVTPAHDFNDYAVGERHDLPCINILNADASINDNAPAAYRGMDRMEAREAVVADLTRLDLLESVEPHALTVPRGDRSGAVLEPWLTDQWWVDVKPLAEPAIEAVRDGRIRFVPRQYENMYFAWMRDVQDWCISRQLWWGHRVPAWYDGQGNVYVGRNESEARNKGGVPDGTPLTQDADVLDTWFSSALWTFATLGWPEQTRELERFHPTDVLVTGHDIIFFWVARMIMMTLRFTGDVPFRIVYTHGLVRDAHGAKMSKTKGNVLDPLDIVDGISLEDLIAKRTADLTQPQMAAAIEAATRADFPEGIRAYGTDALRFTYCALASPHGRDVNLDLGRIDGYRNFCNKLWNATKFVLMHVDGDDADSPAPPGLADRWIRSRVRRLIEDVERAIGEYRFDLYANAVYEFAWREYCDWYVEFTKPVLWRSEDDAQAARAARRTLLATLDLLLRVAHPLIPYITETLWREARAASGQTPGTIMLEPFPQADDLEDDAEAVASIEWLKAVVVGIRNIRGEMGIASRVGIDLIFQAGDATDRERLRTAETLLRRMAGVESITWLNADEDAPPAAVQVVGNLKVLVPLAGLIDIDQECERLQKTISRFEHDLARSRGKLGNENFVTKAPAAVVEKEREKVRDLETKLATMREQLARLNGAP
ncbi:MAG: valine--tRNA ligase [Gammaproteobacteria bacterium]|nr:valine--tRNA ligase [Gammaproteobacteria bacterium]